MKTSFISEKDIERKWFVLDAKDKILGRLASEAAKLLIGKHKPTYSTNQDTGDHVIIINSADVKLTGNKELQKTYFRHSTYPGGGKTIKYLTAKDKDGAFPVTQAIRGMLPKNARGRAIFKKLHVYAGPEHQQQAQKPEALNV